ncbi:porin [Vibrio sp. S9_S30]|uniref:porin n=1 Tax=Vibrio sp. S9_S30 TaxID=2720226 RepID=UPI001680E9CE|nr:porin [Vibrio sp. S9_S30]MBD1557899.1 porin [Vibrio sp. S9_S30]
MKKTLVALAVMAVAGSANASIELYNKDGVTANLKGDIEVRYKKDTKKDSELTQTVDDADFAFDLRYALNDDLQVGGFFEVQDTGTDIGDAYIGFYSASMGDIVFGRTATILDDLGIGNDYLFGIKSAVDSANFSGSEVVKYNLDKGKFYGGIAFMQNKSGHGTPSADNDGGKMADKDSTHIDAKLGARFGDADVAVFFGQSKGLGSYDKTTKVASVSADSTLKTVAVEGAYTIDALKLEAMYAQFKVEDKVRIIGAAATYTVDAWTFSGGISNSKADGEDAQNDAYVNAGYALTSNVTAYAELGHTSADNTETGYGFGVKASF